MQEKEGKLTFCCEDCAYFERLYTFSYAVSSYWESDYGLCTKEEVCHPVLCWDEVCGYFTESSMSAYFRSLPEWHPDEALLYPEKFWDLT